MAVDIIQPDDLSKPKQSGPTPTQLGSTPASSPPSPSGTSPSPAPTVAPANSTSGPAPAKQGTGFTNIQRVLGANQGNKLGVTVGSGITGQATQASQALGQAQQQFGTASQAGRVQYGQNEQQKLQQILANPENASQEDIDFATKYRTGQYGGPTGLANTTSLQQQAAQAQALGQLAGSEGGRAGLLQRFVGGAGYGGGQQKLDQLLLGRTGGSALAQARQQTLGLTGKEQTAEQAAGQQAQQYGSEAAGTRNEVTGKIGEAETGLEQGLAGRLSSTQAQRTADYNTMLQAIQSGKLTPEQAQQFGMGVTTASGPFGGLITSGTNRYGVDLSKFITQGQQATTANVATAQDYARAAALAKLGGTTNTFLPEANATQAGTLGSAYTINAPAAQQAIAANQQAYQNQISPLNARIQAAQQLQAAQQANTNKNTKITGAAEVDIPQIAALQAQLASISKQYGF